MEPAQSADGHLLMMSARAIGAEAAPGLSFELTLLSELRAGNDAADTTCCGSATRARMRSRFTPA